MPTTHIAKYPIVDPNPTMGKTIYNFNFADYTHIAMFTLSGTTVGWFGGKYCFVTYFSN